MGENLDKTKQYWTVGRTNTSRVNLSYLQDMAGGDTDFIVEVIEMFMASAPDAIKESLNCNKLGNYPHLRATVHRLKPTIQMLGDTELHQLAVTIEDQCMEAECMDEAEKQLFSDKVITFGKEAQSLLKALEQTVADLRKNAA